ncbi:restriction endonuclease subunit S, partial [Neisseria sp. P0021.S007]|uniref:restriction endonuclease subunit S n=1 Tax=Neisseria sp. P0021.S007 TaxID=3436822 RepID=UPI003F8063EE
LEANPYFLSYQFQTNRKINEIAKITTGNTIKHILSSDMKEFVVDFPMVEEQTHLGLFFRRLDSQIAESRAVLEKSRQLKKAMLAKMFPANGEKIPKIRFKGFEGEWECRKLGIEVEIIGGGTPDTTNSAYWNGDIDWYSPTEIGEAAYANGSVKKITLLGLQKSSAQILPANRTVLFTSRASIGDMAILTKDGATNQGFQSFVVREKLDVYFLYTM